MRIRVKYLDLEGVVYAIQFYIGENNSGKSTSFYYTDPDRVGLSVADIADVEILDCNIAGSTKFQKNKSNTAHFVYLDLFQSLEEIGDIIELEPAALTAFERARKIYEAIG